MCLKTAGEVANSVEPGQMLCSAASHLGLYCLLRPVSVQILRVDTAIISCSYDLIPH